MTATTMFDFPATTNSVPAWLSTDPDEVRQALSVKEGWQQFLGASAVRPKPLTPKQIGALSDSRRAEYNQRRTAYHRSLIVVRHSQLLHAWEQMRHVVQGQHADDGPGVGVALTGGPGYGKTAALTGFLRTYENELRAAYPAAFTQENETIPVAYSSLLRGCGLKAQMTHLLNFFGHPVSPRTTGPGLVDEVVKVLNRCSTKILALDQAQNLRAGDRKDEEVAAYLKEIMDSAHVTLILCGINIDTSGPLAPSATGLSSMDRLQLARRFVTVPILRLSRDDDEWRQLLASMEHKVVLAKAVPGDLSNGLADDLWDLTDGAIGVAFNIVHIAANAAIANGTERITRATLRRTARTIDAAHNDRLAS